MEVMEVLGDDIFPIEVQVLCAETRVGIQKAVEFKVAAYRGATKYKNLAREVKARLGKLAGVRFTKRNSTIAKTRLPALQKWLDDHEFDTNARKTCAIDAITTLADFEDLEKLWRDIGKQ